MKNNPLSLFGRALLDYQHSHEPEVLLMESINGDMREVPVSVFFRSATEYYENELPALEQCYGSILNVGAGAGIHALFLQDKGFDVAAIDICPEAVQVMRERGVANVRCIDFFDLKGEAYDTILMLGQNVGIAQTLSGLEHLFDRCRELIQPQGQLLLNSVGDRAWSQVECHSKYPGEEQFRINYKGCVGPLVRWLHIDSNTLCEYVNSRGWAVEILAEDSEGAFSARLYLENPA
jgi:SAM-dependent methyltransferase